MKNKTKGLIALIAMTAATAIAAGSSTFAWFTTNRSANLSFNKITIQKRGSNELKAELLNLGLETLSADKQSLTVATPANAEASDISSKDGVQLYAPVWGNKVGDAQKVSKVDTVIDATNSKANKWFTEFAFKLTNVQKRSDTTKLNVFFNDDTLLKAVTAVEPETGTAEEKAAAKAAQQAKNDAAADWSRVAIISLNGAPADHAAVGSSSTLNPQSVLTFEKQITTTGNSSEEYVEGTTLNDDDTMKIGTYESTDRHYYTFADPETYYDDTHVASSAMVSDNAKKGFLVTLDPDTGDGANSKYFLVRVWLEGTENDNQEAADGGEIELNLGFDAYGLNA